MVARKAGEPTQVAPVRCSNLWSFTCRGLTASIKLGRKDQVGTNIMVYLAHSKVAKKKVFVKTVPDFYE